MQMSDYHAFLTFYSSTKVMVVCTKLQFAFVSICLTFTFDPRHTKSHLLNTCSFKLAVYLPKKAKLLATGLLPRDFEHDNMHEVVIGLGRTLAVARCKLLSLLEINFLWRVCCTFCTVNTSTLWLEIALSKTAVTHCYFSLFTLFVLRLNWGSFRDGAFNFNSWKKL